MSNLIEEIIDAPLYRLPRLMPKLIGKSVVDEEGNEYKVIGIHDMTSATVCLSDGTSYIDGAWIGNYTLKGDQE